MMNRNSESALTADAAGTKLMYLSERLREAIDDAMESAALDPVISFLADSFPCDRIYLFERSADDTYDNTLEWCAEGVAHKQAVLQHLSREICSPYYERYRRGGRIVIYHIEEIAQTDRELYEILKPESVESLVSFPIALHGKDLGFFGIDNPQREDIDTILLLARTLAGFLSLWVDAHTEHREVRPSFREMKFSDMGSWNELYTFADSIDKTRSIGIVFSNLLGLGEINSSRGRASGDSLLIEAGQIFRNVFGTEQIFRTNGDDFIVVCSDVSGQWFSEHVEEAKNCFLDRSIAIEIGAYWADSASENFDRLLRRAADQKEPVEDHPKEDQSRNSARITLPRGGRFLQMSNTWLREYTGQEVACIAVDYNYFMLYNNLYGWDAGNHLLEELARLLDQAIRRENGIVGYMGGDNFCVFVPFRNERREELRSRLQQEIALHTRVIGFTPTYGIYIQEYHGESAAKLYDYALSALSQVRGDYENHISIFNQEQMQSFRETHVLLMDIQEGLANHEFSFYVQPIVNMKTDRIVAVEALARWNRNDQVMETKVFLKQLERSGFVYALDRFIWEEACKWLKDLKDRDQRPVPVAVNVSGVDFYFGDVAADLLHLISKYGIDPTWLRVELSEETYTEGGRKILDFIARMNENNIRIFLDDYGSGDSSLDLVRAMRINTLKIERKYLSGIEDDERSRRNIETIISMAHVLGIHIIAEGIESARQKETLLSMNCLHGQGRQLYWPMLPEKFEEILRNPDQIDYSIETDFLVRPGRISFRGLLNEKLIDEYTLGRVVGPIAVYEVYQDKIQVLQMNELYYDLLGISRADDELASQALERLDSDYEEILESFKKVDRNPMDNESYSGFTRPDGSRIMLKATIIPLAQTNGHRLYLAKVEIDSKLWS